MPARNTHGVRDTGGRGASVGELEWPEIGGADRAFGRESPSSRYWEIVSTVHSEGTSTEVWLHPSPVSSAELGSRSSTNMRSRMAMLGRSGCLPAAPGWRGSGRTVLGSGQRRTHPIPRRSWRTRSTSARSSQTARRLVRRPETSRRGRRGCRSRSRAHRDCPRSHSDSEAVAGGGDLVRDRSAAP